jgi:hypothetical protein
MRFSPVAPRGRSSHTRLGAAQHASSAWRTGGRREESVAAGETVALVLDEDAPPPDTAQDIEDLVHRLRGHILQLGAVVPVDSSVLKEAQQASALPLPDDYMPSRVYLVHLARATQRLIETARREATGLAPRPW